MTIGNIPKDVRRKPSRRAQILIGYIPVTKLQGITNKTGRRRALGNLFHACMHKVLGPISHYGEVGLPMMGGDGIWHRCHPILAAFVGDYPEQALVTCTYNGRCPKCTVPLDQLGQYEIFPPHVQHEAIDTYLLADEDIHTFHAACRRTGLKPVQRPFWTTLPLADIFVSITPDILHQLLQGVMKHLIGWLIKIFGAETIDAQCRALPPNHKVMLFTKGIASLSRVTGKEHKKMCSILLGLVADLPVPGGRNSSRVIKAVRGLLDFLQLAQFESHSTDTLDQLQSALFTFHENKDVFIDLEIRRNFNFPKLHSLMHYVSSIQWFGTTDNYNTEQSEHLHIDFTKEAYRATNRKDEYAQMTLWLERREKIQQHTDLIIRRQQVHQQTRRSREPIGPPHAHPQTVKIAVTPSSKAVSFEDITKFYNAIQFQDALGDFITKVNHPSLTGNRLHSRASNTFIPFHAVPVFHHIKFTKRNRDDETEISDAIQVRPEQRDARGRIIPSRFDTVLVQTRGQEGQGPKGD